jgi:hypothetical protein
LTALTLKPLQVSPEAINLLQRGGKAERHTAFSSVNSLAREKAPSSLRFADALQIRLLKRNQTWPR